MPIDSDYQFRRSLTSGELYIRDQLQFELKSDFVVDLDRSCNRFVQEFYMFVPEALQIRSDTYSRDAFYRDQTNFVRYKTPAFPLERLLDRSCQESPLSRLEQTPSGADLDGMVTEAKLLANVSRSSLRNEVSQAIGWLDRQESPSVAEAHDKLQPLILHSKELWQRINTLVDVVASRPSAAKIEEDFIYVREFVQRSLDYFFTGLLIRVRELPEAPTECDKEIVSLIHSVAGYRNKREQEGSDRSNEEFHYRRSLLNKYVLEPLKIKISKRIVEAQYAQAIGAFAAGLAMFTYLVLFIWKSNYVAFNSAPFVLASVILYILKDRVKEGVKLIWKHRAAQWFPDHVLEMREPRDDSVFGELREYVSFLKPKNLPDDIVKVRNKEFHNTLESFQRPETVLYARKELVIKDPEILKNSRLRDFNTIFRLNIQKFIEKSAEPMIPYPLLDLESNEIRTDVSPKVYHLNIIIKQYMEQDGMLQSTGLRKYRLIVDKNGIKRVEHPN